MDENMKIGTKSENGQSLKPQSEERYVSPPGVQNQRTVENDINKRMDMFTTEKPMRRLEDLVVSEKTKKQMASLLTKVKYHDVLYEDFGLKEVDATGGRTAINLYGPPGTGKSFAAEAIANELNMDIIRVNYAEIESKFVGETPKNIKAVFQKAKESNAVLFFDEADSILGKRLSNITQSTDHAVNVSRSVMLLELDNFSGITIFATNFASNYDSAFVRRILGHIEMPLPDKSCREMIFKKLIPSKLPIELSKSDRECIIIETEWLSGGDILNIIVNASSMALEREGYTCKVRLNDFITAIHSSKKAKEEIGR
ncbi:ATP-binding protein [Fusibacter bizertensis]|uniref:ATP-binding protein n=1 Tax=Fusibacter bizertensis TaxID=1488331 RepID=A0ABT6NF95_9FIRM|nr:ATP-binding protein [Fusibacter bizertensis]MDH8679100.1 ATP-binding protein [Fusibacter bizertensis]